MLLHVFVSACVVAETRDRKGAIDLCPFAARAKLHYWST